MDEEKKIGFLKKTLRAEVAAFCRNDGSPWKEAVVLTVEEIREKKWRAVFFGGTLRSLLWARVNEKSPGRPRDIDIVMQGVPLSELKKQFGPYVDRYTRFGGLKLSRGGFSQSNIKWQFDIWPLEETYALKHFGKKIPSFEDLPDTTFFNVEAVAVEVWPREGRARRIYSKDDQFFRGLINRTIEVNREETPYPELCVARALVMAAQLDWKVGPRLLRFMGLHGARMSAVDFEDVQLTHYGSVRCSGAFFKKAMERVESALDQQWAEPIELKLHSRLTLWPEDEDHAHRLWRPDDKSIKRSRDMEQLRKLFAFVNLQVMDIYIDRMLNCSRLTNAGQSFGEYFFEVLSSSTFFLYDKKLLRLVTRFSKAWAPCLGLYIDMEQCSSGLEAFFDTRDAVDQEDARLKRRASQLLSASARPLRKALDALVSHVREEFVEFDLEAASVEAVKRYKEEEASFLEVHRMKLKLDQETEEQ